MIMASGIASGLKLCSPNCVL